MRLRLSILAALCTAFVAGAPSALADQPGTSDTHAVHYYLSLGDSLAESFQPNGDLSHGYAEQLHATLAADDPKLELVNLGCGGESTVSMRYGSQDPNVVGSCGTPRYYKVLYPKGTQLARAATSITSAPRSWPFRRTQRGCTTTSNSRRFTSALWPCSRSWPITRRTATQRWGRRPR
jgi:hypothetical protein